MECPECHYNNREGAKFCNDCGHKFEVICTECKASNSVGSKFCDECGYNLAEKQPQLPKELSFDEKIDKIQRYLPKGVTEKILSQRGKIEGERKQVTVMFCDMEGFTSMVERLGAEDAYNIMDQVYELLIHKVHDYDGTINEMTGDGIMALFGAPIALEDAPQRAIRSALVIHQEVGKFDVRMRDKLVGIPRLKMRIGIHTGPVVVGTLGNDLRVEFKAVGDTVNTASRMEGLAEPGTVCISADTFQLAEGLFQFEALGVKEVKGKEKPIKVYRVLGPSSRMTRFDVNTERGLTPFIGRGRELELLIDGFERIRDGRGQAISIVGEAGLGKSRLLYELRKAVARENVTFLEGKCLSFSSNVAYHPVIDVLKSNFLISDADNDADILEKVKDDLKVLEVDEASTLPYLLELLSVRQFKRDDIKLNPETMRDRIIEALKRILINGSWRRPVILAIEDLHWLDKSSEETFKSLLDTISGERIFLIFTYRPEYIHTWGSKSYHSQVNLNRLSNKQSLTMATDLLNTKGIDRALEELILEKTEGVPFFVEEFIKSLLSLKIIEKKDNIARLISGSQASTIPATIQDVIMARIDRLPEGAKEVLQTGSVIEREFSYGLIKSVTDLPEQKLLSHLSALKDFELLFERGIYPNSTYVFKHALTQEVSYNSLLKKRRKGVHSKIAGAMERLYSERLEEFYEKLAHHYLECGNFEKASEYLKLSAKRAAEKYSNIEAFRFYENLIQALDQLPDSEVNKREKAQAMLSIYTPMRLLAFPEGSSKILEEGLSLSKEMGDAKLLNLFYGSLGKLHTFNGNIPKARKYLEACFQESSKSNDINMIAPAAYDLTTLYGVIGEHAKNVEFIQKVIGLIEESKRESDFFNRTVCVYPDLLAMYGLCLGTTGNFKDGEYWLEKGLKYSKKLGHVYTTGWVESHYGAFYIFKGEGIKCIEHGMNAFECFKKANANAYLGWQLGGVGYGYYLKGELDRAFEYTQKGYKMQKELNMPNLMSFYHLIFGCIHFAASEHESARNKFEKAVELSQSNYEKGFEGYSWICLGRTIGKMDSSQQDNAEECIQRGIDILEKIMYKSWLSHGYLFLGEFYLHTNNRKKAVEYLRKAEENFQDMEIDFYLDKTQEVLNRF